MKRKPASRGVVGQKSDGFVRSPAPSAAPEPMFEPVRLQLNRLFAEVRLTPAQRRIATHIVEHGAETAFLSSVELAEQTGVSQPSVTRFATALGFSGYSDLQRTIRDIVRADDSRRPVDMPQNKMQSAVNRSVSNLMALNDLLSDLTALNEAAELLASSPVLVYGCRSSAAFAAHFAYFGRKIHPDLRLASGATTVVLEQLAEARLAGAQSLLAVILPRYPREAAEVLRFASSTGTRVVLVTDSVASPLAEHAEIVLAAAVNPELVFDTAVAPLQLLGSLLEAIADVDSVQSRHRLDELEMLASDEYFYLSDRR
jgi:DNA-binding MurR/RpiR family transcriptional regulator